MKKLKKSKYDKDIEFVNLFKSDIDFLDEEKKSIPIKTTFVEKKENGIDRFTLYSFDGPFQLLHADVGSLEFLGKSATSPKYCLLFIDLFTSKINVYPMKSRKSIANKMDIFYKEVEEKRKGQKQGFKQTRNLNKRNYFS